MGQNDVEVVNGNKVSLAFPPRRMVKGVADYLLGFVEARMTEICFEEQPLHKVMSPIKVAFVFDPKLPADRIGVDSLFFPKRVVMKMNGGRMENAEKPRDIPPVVLQVTPAVIGLVALTRLYSENGKVVHAKKQQEIIRAICSYVGGLLEEVAGVQSIHSQFIWKTLLVMGQGLSTEGNIGQDGAED